MLIWTGLFLFVTVVAGFAGFSGVAVGAESISRGVFYFFLVLTLLSVGAHILGLDEKLRDDVWEN